MLETSEIQHSDSSGVHMGYTLYENCGGKGIGMVGPQTVVSTYLDRDVFSPLITKPYGGYSVAVVVFPE